MLDVKKKCHEGCNKDFLDYRLSGGGAHVNPMEEEYGLVGLWGKSDATIIQNFKIGLGKLMRSSLSCQLSPNISFQTLIS